MGQASDNLRDSLLSHQLGLRRLSNSQLRDLLRILDRNDAEIRRLIRLRLPAIAAQIERVVDPTTGEFAAHLDTFTKRRLANLYKEIQIKRREVMRVLAAKSQEQLLELAAYEQEYVRAVTVGAMPKDIRPFVGELALASEEFLAQIVESRPFQGALLKDHFRRLSLVNGPATRRLRHAIENGLVQGQSIPQIVRQVNVSALKLTRANVSAIAHSAVSHVSNSTREAFGQANLDVVGAYQWVGTLDSKICTVCIVREGYVYDAETLEPLDDGPPWDAGPGRMHFNDRCTIGYVLRSWQELGITRRDLPGATRASMDGQVSAKLSAEEWVNQQGRERLTQMFGPNRARLLTEGNLDIRDLVRKDGTLWSLKRLRQMEAGAFEAAGL